MNGFEQLHEYILSWTDAGQWQKSEEIVRCRDCKHAHAVFWPERDDVPADWVDCTGPLVETWDYYDDEPKDNPVRPDGFCAWGERREDA